MSRLEWVIVTERTIVEAVTGVVSLQSIVETITVPPPPPEMLEKGSKAAVPFRFFLNHQWVRSDVNRGERLDGRVVFLGPDKKPYFSMPFAINLEATARARLITQTPGFPLLGEGEYAFLIQERRGKRWRTVGRTQFEVRFDEKLGQMPTKH